jgi:hypothetical protein
MWVRVWKAIERALKSRPDIGYSVGLTVLDWNEVNQRVAYAIPPGYIDSNDLLLIPSVTD